MCVMGFLDDEKSLFDDILVILTNITTVTGRQNYNSIYYIYIKCCMVTQSFLL